MTDSADPRCGSDAGYQAHRYRGEKACGPCAAAHRAAARGYRPRPVCGTAAAYHAHLRAGEPVDEACREACARASQDSKTRRRRAGRDRAVPAVTPGQARAAARTVVRRADGPGDARTLLDALGLLPLLDTGDRSTA